MSVIDDYFKKNDTPQRAELEKIRNLVHDRVPEAEEVISYGMPGFMYKNNYLVGFNAYKNHLSVFPTSGPVTTFKDRLKDFKTSKGTIQFTIDKPIPSQLITEIILSRLAAIKKD